MEDLNIWNNDINTSNINDSHIQFITKYFYDMFNTALVDIKLKLSYKYVKNSCNDGGNLLFFTNYNFYVLCCYYKNPNNKAYNIFFDIYLIEYFKELNLQICKKDYSEKYQEKEEYKDQFNSTKSYIIKTEFGELNCTKENFKKYIQKEILQYKSYIHPIIILETLYNSFDEKIVFKYLENNDRFNLIEKENEIKKLENEIDKTKNLLENEKTKVMELQNKIENNKKYDDNFIDKLFCDNYECIEKYIIENGGQYNMVSNSSGGSSWTHIRKTGKINENVKKDIDIVYKFFNDIFSLIIPNIKLKFCNKKLMDNILINNVCICCLPIMENMIIYTNYDFYIHINVFYKKETPNNKTNNGNFMPQPIETFKFAIKKYDNDIFNTYTREYKYTGYDNKYDETITIETSYGTINVKSLKEMKEYILKDIEMTKPYINCEIIIDYLSMQTNKDIEKYLWSNNATDNIEKDNIINVMDKNINEIMKLNKNLECENKNNNEIILELKKENKTILSEIIDKDIMIEKLTSKNNNLECKYNLLIEKING
jgi:hypothetical protein